MRVRVVSLRPVTLKTLAKVVEVLVKCSPCNIEEAAQLLGFSSRRIKEIASVLSQMNLVTVKERKIETSPEAREFLDSLKRCDFVKLNSFFLRLEPYRLVFSCYISGKKRLIDIKRETGLNAVMIDIALRIVRELEALCKAEEKYHHLETSINLEKFIDSVMSIYRELSLKRRNRYVPLQELRKAIMARIGLTPGDFERLIEVLVKKYSDKIKISLVPAPQYSSNVKSITIFGKKYSFILIDLPPEG